MPGKNPFTDPDTREPVAGPYAEQEVALANRNHGIALEMLRHDVTPAGMHYLLNHFDVPFVTDVDAAAWRLEIGGLVERPLSLSLAEIKAMPARTLRVTLECAGNGRGRFSPRWPSMPWMTGAVGTAEWTGTPLRGVLDRAGLEPGTVDISFHGIDRGFDKGHEHEFGRSLKPELARHGDVMLVWAMNGQPLLPQHGFPLRLIVPGWYGVANVKWLSDIIVQQDPYLGKYQARWYRTVKGEMVNGEMKWMESAVTHLQLKSFVARVTKEGASHKVTGIAMNDGTAFKSVEVKIDDGPWQPATWDKQNTKYSWKLFHYDWKDATAGEHTIVSRVTDVNGLVQPTEKELENKKSFLEHNAQHPRRVMIA